MENPDKTDGGRLISSYQCDSRIANAEFLFAKRQYLAKTGRKRGADMADAPYPPGCSVTYGQGRVLFAGEIAEFLNPMGEGISAGMESGYCVAQAIANHFDALDMIYADYQRDTQQLKSYMERQWNFVGRMAGTFSEMII